MHSLKTQSVTSQYAFFKKKLTITMTKIVLFFTLNLEKKKNIFFITNSTARSQLFL